MKKQLLALFSFCLVLFATSSSFAQFEKGDKLLNAGLSLGGTYGGGAGLGASFEVGIHDFISVGAQADFMSWSSGWGGYKWRYTFIPVGVRGSYHFGKHFLKMDNLDLYAGPAIGYTFANYKDPSGWSGIYTGGYGGDVYFGVFAGARYYFKENMGVFAELGQNTSALKAGISLKF